MPPTLEMYWINVTNLRISKDRLLKSYMAKMKLIKDKKLAETNFKILNNILPCNKNLQKWGKKDSKLWYICKETKVLVTYCFTVGMLNQYVRL